MLEVFHDYSDRGQSYNLVESLEVPSPALLGLPIFSLRMPALLCYLAKIKIRHVDIMLI